MILKTTAAILVIGSTLVAAEGVAAKQQCYTRQKQVCSYGQSHGTGLVCTTQTVRQCFQVPELRGEKTRVTRFRRK